MNSDRIHENQIDLNMMKYYFTSNAIPELLEFSISERKEILFAAQQKLTVPEKLVLNLLKLVMLVPPFIYIARQDWLTFFLTFLLSAICYIGIFKPLVNYFCANHLPSVIDKIN